MVLTGPGGLRLQEVAADAGVSHPTVLHHFGSREGLVDAVITRSLEAIHIHLVEAIQASGGEEQQLAAMLENVHVALTATGHARVLLWLALEGHRIEAPEARLSRVVDAAHAFRVAQARAKGERAPSREDTAFVVVLASLALTSGAVMAPELMQNAGIAGGEAASARFRAWLAHLLSAHVDRPTPKKR